MGSNNPIKTSKYGTQPVALVRRRTEENDEKYCKKRKNKFLITNNDEEFKRVYKDQFEHQVPLIRIFYGPYEFQGIIQHREQKLYGIVGK